ncbi:MAG: hypothetical protein ACYDCK_07675 [Thermoplasmatota archaeon]
MDADDTGAFRVKLGVLLIVSGLLIAAVEIAAALYALKVVGATPDESWGGVTLFVLPLVVTMIGAGLFLEVSAYEWRHHSRRVEAQDEPPHGPRPGF